MRIFAIRDEEANVQKDLAYLIYYEKEKRFYIELPEDADPWETPLILSSFLKKGEKTVNAYWSRLWVQQRIVPSDRQNLGEILKENDLKEYDEFALLMLGNGRCAQDSYYLTEITGGQLPKDFVKRFNRKVEDVVPLFDHCLLVFFHDGTVRKIYAGELLATAPTLASVLYHEEIFNSVNVQTGGYGICWGENLQIDDAVLYRSGDLIPLSLGDFHQFVSLRVVTTTEACQMLHCSRQNIDDLINRGKLHPVKTGGKTKLFLENEIRQRLWL